MNKPLIIPVFIPHFGCPHACVFCNQQKIAGDYQLPDYETLWQQVCNYRESCCGMKEREVQLAFYGGSFTGLDITLQEELLKIAEALKAQRLIQKIRLSTRPDCIDEQRLLLLEQYGVDIVELGVQSMADDVLLASQRGHTIKDVHQAVTLIKQHQQLQLGLQMMIALPKDTPAKSMNTARMIAELAPDFVRIYPTAIIKDTILAALWQNGLYQEWPFDMILDTAAQVLQIFEDRQIPVIRIGLQAADNLQYGQDLLAGAYHPAMGELVKSRRFRLKIERVIQQIDSATLDIYCHQRDISQIIGQHRCNLTYFQEHYGRKLNVIPDNDLIQGEFIIQETTNHTGV